MKNALKKTSESREKALIEACDAVNADPAVNELVDLWQAMDDPIEEPWDEGGDPQ